ncbi:DUF998 domain-containing protein [Echinicola rosea]|uniref:DUF998 domain-containing protein n=1 Tax=Echinicola rosea TaxID=1807691 RepID=UPI0010CA6B0B|nr:DUF998 domain-containing protein [Echinicola rosea]
MKIIGIIGLTTVLLLFASLLIFGNLNKDFSFFQDYISSLGAKGAPFALGWNICGFVLVGLGLVGFGFMYGLLLKDKIAAVCLSLFGTGYAFTAIPMDMELTNSAVSKAHVLAICLGLAAWFVGLSRIGFNLKIHKNIRNRANITAFLLTIAMTGYLAGLWSMPFTHWLVFGLVFGWTAFTSFGLLTSTTINDTAER